MQFSGKRNLTINNKDINVYGKIWSERFTNIILHRVLPDWQFNCHKDRNIIDENNILREIVEQLRGDGNNEIDGTLLAIDFKNAFRSVFHRWFSLTMVALNIPASFREWFWSLYEDLGLKISINGHLSEMIEIRRGLMEGHPPSMACYVASTIPMLNILQERLIGIKLRDDRLCKAMSFADDTKAILKYPSEISIIYDVVSKFEVISGIEMHRDRSRKKCQALSFGSHRDVNTWPEWVSVADEVKILGVSYTNKKHESLDEVNSKKILEAVRGKINGAFTIRGTLFQKAFYINTIVLSKVWYVAQTIRLTDECLDVIDKRCWEFLHHGQNEKPVKALNYRQTSEGGLGLVSAKTKAKALLVKNVLKNNLPYSFGYDFEVFECQRLGLSDVKNIYAYLLKDITENNGSIIPSRSEGRNEGISWGVSRKNFLLMRGVSPSEKEFYWKIVQDMLLIGARYNRANSVKTCQVKIFDPGGNESLCGIHEDRPHVFWQCPHSRSRMNLIIHVVELFLKKRVTEKEIIHFTFSDINKNRMRVAIFFVIKMLMRIYNKRIARYQSDIDCIIKSFEEQNKASRKITKNVHFGALLNILFELKRRRVEF